MSAPTVAILMGSDSDLPVMAGCAKVLEQYGIGYDIRVLSAHRSPDEAPGPPERPGANPQAKDTPQCQRPE